MIRTLLARLQQGHRTMAYPDGPPPPLPPRFRGRPVIDPDLCVAGCSACVAACPTGALSLAPRDSADGAQGAGAPRLDLGRCLFCPDCAEACAEVAAGQPTPTRPALRHLVDHRLSVRRREDLQLAAAQPRGAPDPLALSRALDAELLRLLGRSLKLRQVSAGGCNACEADVNVLATVGWDLGRFGIQVVASPRHADGLLITGPVSRNMELALRKTYDAVPPPKIVIATGACAISGGPYIGQPEVLGGADQAVPVDLYIPGCPPHPLTILDGLLRLLGKLKQEQRLPT